LFDDYLLCMISSQLRHFTADFDERIETQDEDFTSSGLKEASVIRVGRLAVVQGDVLPGAIGQIAAERLERIRRRLADWITTA
jgi:mRNA interferase MazF